MLLILLVNRNRAPWTPCGTFPTLLAPGAARQESMVPEAPEAFPEAPEAFPEAPGPVPEAFPEALGALPELSRKLLALSRNSPDSPKAGARTVSC